MRSLDYFEFGLFIRLLEFCFQLIHLILFKYNFLKSHFNSFMYRLLFIFIF